MDDKRLKKMKRFQLLEIMLKQAEKIEELEKEITKLNNQLEDRKILLSDVGSIAEASLKLNDIFTKADETANLYVESTKEKCDKEYQNATLEAQKIIDEAQKKSELLIEEAKKNIKKETKVKKGKVKTNANKNKKSKTKKK